jgi:hypothetical protein
MRGWGRGGEVGRDDGVRVSKGGGRSGEEVGEGGEGGERGGVCDCRGGCL